MRYGPWIAALLAALCLSLPAVATAAEGDLDTSFDSDGTVTTPFGDSSTDVANAVAVDAQGRVVAAGYSGSGSNHDFAVARYNPNGSLDTSFDHDGKVTTPIVSDDYAQAVAIDGQGRIVVAGYALFGGDYDFAIARYNPDGSLDTSFSDDGKQLVDFTPSAGDNDKAYAMAIDAQGRIVLAGQSKTTSYETFALARLTTAGALDTSFDSDGMATTGSSGSSNLVRGVAIDAQGRIVAAGYSRSGFYYDFALARYNADGSLDTSFDSDGKVTTKISSTSDGYGYAVALDGQGRIVVAGDSVDPHTLPEPTDMELVRYNPNGSLDTSFDQDGWVTTPIGAGQDQARAIAIDARGRIVAAGDSENGSGGDDIALVRYNANGSLDTAFSADGKVTTPIPGGNAFAQGVAIDRRQRIVAAGYGGGGTHFVLARYIGDQTPPPVAIASGPRTGSYIKDATPTFGFFSEAGATFRCGFDGHSVACHSPFTPASPLGNGPHTFAVRATDRAGNTSAPATRRFTVDTRKPTITIDGKAQVKTKGTKARETLKLKANEPVTFTCKLDKAKARKCGTAYTTPKLGLGKHEVVVTATDRARNSSSKTKRFEIVHKR